MYLLLVRILFFSFIFGFDYRLTNRDELVVLPLSCYCHSLLVRQLSVVNWHSHVKLTCISSAVWPRLCTLSVGLAIFPLTYISLSICKYCFAFDEYVALPFALYLYSICFELGRLTHGFSTLPISLVPTFVW